MWALLLRRHCWTTVSSNCCQKKRLAASTIFARGGGRTLNPYFMTLKYCICIILRSVLIENIVTVYMCNQYNLTANKNLNCTVLYWLCKIKIPSVALIINTKKHFNCKRAYDIWVKYFTRFCYCTLLTPAMMEL